MNDQELLTHLRFEYHGFQAARRADTEHLGVAREADCTFYDFLLSRGFSRFQLSAHGIGRDIEA